MRHILIAAALIAAPLTMHAQNSVRSMSVAPTQAIAERAPTARPRRIAATTRNQICRGAAIPMGWILVDNQRDAESCDGENPVSLNLYNVWVISRYEDLPVGATLDVCASAQIPDGWQLVDLYRSKDSCGRPSDPFAVNVKRIRRVK